MGFKETADGLQVINKGHSWKTLKKEMAIAARPHPHIKHGKHSAIRAVSDQAPQSLLEADDRGRKLIVHEGIRSLAANPVNSSGDQWISRRVKGEFVNNEAAKRLSWNIHPLPEGACSEEYGMDVCSELIKEYGFGRIALLEKAEGKLSVQVLINQVEVVMACEEHQCPACRDAEQFENSFSGPEWECGIIRSGEILGNVEERFLFKIEVGRIDPMQDLGSKAHPRREITKISARR